RRCAGFRYPSFISQTLALGMKIPTARCHMQFLRSMIVKNTIQKYTRSIPTTTTILGAACFEANPLKHHTLASGGGSAAGARGKLPPSFALCKSEVIWRLFVPAVKLLRRNDFHSE